ncbi:hypothetical protein NitYY0826_C0069 [Nitratiruptor sp. YY08-26]|uniref:hypothetical protein n=1 Tax=unclassified Nitratiruptor TaxID=2624044 RepID=UPI001915FF9E|nr:MULTISPECIES: hypothetical protein [unclassified Nitratiruptor]BCD61236.1 hypothetical protein NitYY0813_C0069 [Nitratiruptor sp. YY08-13]BCD65169.1 hypothetical protein NitYY0826_C0069 [Nitratiruptor sp. YY08-26]
MKYFILLIAWILFGADFEPATPVSYRPKQLQSSSLPSATPLYATARIWDRDLAFVEPFEIVELGGIADLLGKDLHDFNKIVAYEWSAGFYKDEINPLITWVKKHPQTLLYNKPNKEGAYFYDMCNEDLVQKRFSYLLAQKHKLGIVGYFFDWANEEFLHEKAFAKYQERFKKKHPHGSYAKCLQRFFQKLRNAGLLIITNQAYRNENLLESVDYDMCESYMTQVDNTSAMANIEDTLSLIPTTIFVPLDEVFDYFKTFSQLKKKYHFKQMIYLNYAAPIFEAKGDLLVAKKPRDIIYYNYALAKLGGFYSYTEVPFNHELEKDPLYFIDLGKPLEKMQQRDGIYWRLFQNGFVIVAPSLTKPLYLRIKVSGLIDVKEQISLQAKDGWTAFALKPIYYNFENRYLPQAKVFLYADKVLHK